MKNLLFSFIIIAIAACSKTEKTDDSQPMMLDIVGIAAHFEIDIRPYLGKATPMESVTINGKKHSKYSYKDGAVEIVYINKKADWITITLNEGKFDKSALGILGLPIAEPTKSNQNVIRWENYRGILSISLFPKADGTIDYFYIKTITP